jgi:rhamnogalacturonan endolyase
MILTSSPRRSLRLLQLAVASLLLFVTGGLVGRADAPAANPPVTITDGGETVTMDNGVLTMTIRKSDANLLSLLYKSNNLLHGGQAYWNVYGSTPTSGVAVHTQTKGQPSVFTITQDPTKNGGEMGEIELLFPYKGANSTTDDGLGTVTAPTEPLDIAIRYTLKRGDSGFYGWTSVSHKPGYPAFDLEACGTCFKLDPKTFDHLTIDSRRDKQMINGYDWMHGTPLNLKEARRMTTGIHQGEVEHKYDYSMLYSETPAYGWSSSTKDLGIWIINPTTEYISSGPIKVDYTGHIDLKDTPTANPTLLFGWLSFHFGGVAIAIGQDEDWQKVIGPYYVYCNSGATPDDMWHDALARAAVEKKEWPYDWAKMDGYANAQDRGAVTGSLTVKDPQQASATAADAWVGLAAPPYMATDQQNKPFNVSWQTDGKNYEYWVHADDKGAFTIHARPGTYELYAFNNGILGEYSKADVTVEAGKTADLGNLTWVPVRYGKQIWDIGIPNRSAEEFRHGDHYWTWGLYNLYPQEFPNGVNYVIGKSDYSKDWNYVQPPTLTADGKYTGTTWKITFNMDTVPTGTATLRLGICGTRNTTIDVGVNGHPAGSTGLLPSSGVMHRDGIRGVEYYSNIPFDTSLLTTGTNVITLTTHARAWTDGVLYDYLRLEIGDGPPATTTASN